MIIFSEQDWGVNLVGGGSSNVNGDSDSVFDDGYLD